MIQGHRLDVVTDSPMSAQESTSFPTKLDAWLARATHGLCPQARERVQREIAAHYDEAFEHLRGTEMSPEAADALALEGLGDDATANKALRKTYLTNWQQRLLASLSEPVKPLTRQTYGGIVENTSPAPFGALLAVYLDYQPNPPLTCFVIVLFSVFLGAWTLEWKIIRSLHNRLREWRNKEPLTEDVPTTNQFYPWALIACYLSIYAVWRCYYWNISIPNGILFDLCLIGICSSLYARTHRLTGAYCFSPTRKTVRKRIAAAVTYIAFLSAASVACLLWPPTMSLISWFSLPFIGFSLGPAYYRSPEESVDAIIYGMAGIILALSLCIVATRWTIGLCLMRKDVCSEESSKPVSAPFPETPLGD